MSLGRSLGESISGALVIIGAILTPFLGPLRRRWGATDKELELVLPGDALVATPRWGATHAVTVKASAAEIWPWLLQIGQGRGGFYSYEKLENLVGCEIKNAVSIQPELQDLRRGDLIRLHPQAPAMRVAILERERELVIEGRPAPAPAGGQPGGMGSAWGFYLQPAEDGSTRLLSRTRYSHALGCLNTLMGGTTLIEPISFAMERKMLLVLKQLVEASTPGEDR